MENMNNAAATVNFDNAATRAKVAAFYDAKALYLILSDALTEARGEEARLREEENAARSAFDDAGYSREGRDAMFECIDAHDRMYDITVRLIIATRDAYADFVYAAKAAADFDLNAAFAVYCDAEAEHAAIKTAIDRAANSREKYSSLYWKANDARKFVTAAYESFGNAEATQCALSAIADLRKDLSENMRRERLLLDDLYITERARRAVRDAAKKRYEEMRDEEENAALWSAVASVADFNAF